MPDTRTERDSMGPVEVPAGAYYAAQTQRAVDNFRISGRPLPPALVRAMGLVKYACGVANRDLGKLTGSGKNPLDDQAVDALLAACREVADGMLADQFPVDIYQTGSGTSSNMNVNEVLAARATELAGGDRFAADKAVHPNDHVNMGQSTNDTFPTAIHVAAARAVRESLVPALERLRDELRTKADAWDDVIKIGRTHLADATPLRLGQEFGGFARQLELAAKRATKAAEPLYELPVGGTAVGSGINTHPEFGRRVAAALAEETALPFVEAEDHFEANADRDGLVEAHALLKAVAVTVFNVANDLRWLGSGPRCGFHEISLPDLQPGSSIMPGKVNPVVCEAALQAAARAVGNDATVALAGAAGGNFQLNIMMPLLGAVTLESVELLTNSAAALADMVRDTEANREACEAAVEKSLSMVTSLNPHIGYEKAAALAKEAFKTGKTIRDLCREKNVLPEEVLAEALDPRRMTEPQA